jgi:HPt (histidine-containing phosphotransfer) domain-containing protein
LPPTRPARAIDHYFAGDQALYAAYRDSCRRQFAHDRRAGDAALAAGDHAGLRRLAHSLKTVLQTLGHDDDSAVARQLEHDASDGRTEAAHQGWARLGQALDRLSADGSPHP